MTTEAKEEAAVRVACDVGGTFTDVCFLNEASGRIHVAKTPTTPDPIDGVLKGIDAGGVALKDIILFSHGTTLATNALITRRFPAALMVTTKGFRDVIEIRRGTRESSSAARPPMVPPPRLPFRPRRRQAEGRGCRRSFRRRPPGADYRSRRRSVQGTAPGCRRQYAGAVRRRRAGFRGC